MTEIHLLTLTHFQAEMEELDNLRDNLNLQEQMFKSAVDSENEILKKCSEEDRPMLTEKLNNVAQRYNKLKAKIST